jgi:YkoY family integral membrane protein
MTDLLILVNIFVLEVILSIDNAAVLATMVKPLAAEKRKKALTYGLLGAYLFRGLALILASWLIKLTWLKVLGGAYLAYIAWKSLYKPEGDKNPAEIKIPFLSQFWSIIFMVEIMDLVFSIDNVFAAVAFTSNLWLICGGVFIGILAMRFATGKFISLLEKNPVLEKVAYYVIGSLGLKLMASYWIKGLTTEYVDLIFSGGVLLAFILPIILGRKK